MRLGIARPPITGSLDDTGAGPARKVYSLTPEGVEMLDLWATSLEETLRLPNELKARYEGLGRGKSDPESRGAAAPNLPEPLSR